MKKKVAILLILLGIPLAVLLYNNFSQNKENSEEELATKDDTIYQVQQPIENEIMKIIVYPSELSKEWRGKEDIKEWLQMERPEIPVEDDGTLGEGYTYVYTQIEATNKTTKDHPRAFTEFQTGMDIFSEPKINPDDSNRLSLTYGVMGKDLFNPHVNFVSLDYQETKMANLYSIIKEDSLNKESKYYGAVDLRSDMNEKEDIPRFVELDIKEEANE